MFRLPANRLTVFVIFFCFCRLAAIAQESLSLQRAEDQIRSPINTGDRRYLAGLVPSFASSSNDQGHLSPNETIGHIMITLRRPPARQQAFEAFLSDLQNPNSARYHSWMNPSDIGSEFGPSDSDITKITDWLTSQGLRVEEVSSSRTIITFTGTVDQLEKTFSSELHRYIKNGRSRIAINRDPSIPAAIAAIVQGVVGLSTLSSRSTLSGFDSPPSVSPRPLLTTPTGSHAIFPADFAAIYDLNLLYWSQITGAGQTVAVIGDSRVENSDIEDFEALAGLPIVDPVVVIPPLGADPLTTRDQEQLEATLDVERVLGTAPGAKVTLVVSADDANGNGVSLASQYAIQQNLAQVVNISFGSCEAEAGQSATTLYNNLFSQAAAQGISVFVSSGDAGAAGCDTTAVAPPLVQQKSPNYICSSGYVTCVGGTEFVEGSGQYWASSGTATGYIPEGAWNDSTSLMVSGTGGGASQFISKPSWQTGAGVPADGARDTPDISLSASPNHDPYAICAAFAGSSCSTGIFHYVGGTSAAAPGMAGIQALINQRVGKAQGNINSFLYTTAANTSLNAFQDVTLASTGIANCIIGTPSLCNNSTSGPSALPSSGVQGYTLGTGYDQATGLGSIDAFNLAQAADGNPTRAVPLISLATDQQLVGDGENSQVSNLTATLGKTSNTSPLGTVSFVATCLLGCRASTTSLGPPVILTNGVAKLAYTFPGTEYGSIYSIAAIYSGDLNNAAATSSPLIFTVRAGGTLQSSTSISAITPKAGTVPNTFTVNVAVTYSVGSFSVPCARLSGTAQLLVDGIPTNSFTSVASPTDPEGFRTCSFTSYGSVISGIVSPGPHQFSALFVGGDGDVLYNAGGSLEDPAIKSSISSATAMTVTGPVVTLSVSSLTFVSDTIGTTSAAQSATLTNSGNASLTISPISVSGDFSETDNCGTTVAAGSQCKISVTFTPTVVGTRTGTVTITNNASGSPQTIALSGMGVAPGATAPTVTLSPTSLTFVSQTDGTTSAAQTVTLTNSGTAALAISSITASGDFALTQNCGASVAAGASCAISVTFTPTAAGTRTGTVTITDNAGNSPQTVSLSGGGEAFSLSTASTGITIPSAGGSGTAAVQLSSINGFTGTVNLTCAVTYLGQGTPTSPPTCSLSPSQAQVTGSSPVSSTLTIATTSSSASLVHERELNGAKLALAAMFFFGLLPRRRYRIGFFSALCLIALCLGVGVGMIGCSGSSGGSNAGTTTTGHGTTTGNYQVLVTATSGTVVASTTIPISVQ